jgi:hypothetical protein
VYVEEEVAMGVGVGSGDFDLKPLLSRASLLVALGPFFARGLT